MLTDGSKEKVDATFGAGVWASRHAWRAARSLPPLSRLAASQGGAGTLRDAHTCSWLPSNPGPRLPHTFKRLWSLPLVPWRRRRRPGRQVDVHPERHLHAWPCRQGRGPADEDREELGDARWGRQPAAEPAVSTPAGARRGGARRERKEEGRACLQAVGIGAGSCRAASSASSHVDACPPLTACSDGQRPEDRALPKHQDWRRCDGGGVARQKRTAGRRHRERRAAITCCRRRCRPWPCAPSQRRAGWAFSACPLADCLPHLAPLPIMRADHHAIPAHPRGAARALKPRLRPGGPCRLRPACALVGPWVARPSAIMRRRKGAAGTVRRVAPQPTNTGATPKMPWRSPPLCPSFPLCLSRTPCTGSGSTCTSRSSSPSRRPSPACWVRCGAGARGSQLVPARGCMHAGQPLLDSGMQQGRRKGPIPPPHAPLAHAGSTYKAPAKSASPEETTAKWKTNPPSGEAGPGAVLRCNALE